MAYTKLQLKPGINREGTAYDNEGGWFDCNLIRFRNGHVEKMSGWEKLTTETYLGTARALHNWVALEGNKYLGLGTTWKYYIKEGAAYNDITPVRKTSTNSITFSATSGSAIITATDSSHGAVVNDFVTISSAVSLGGNITAAVLNTEHQITSVPSANTYTFVASATANGSDTGNGGSGVDGVYQINVGLDVYVESTGWGAGLWSAGTWGSLTALSITNQLRLWSQDNFGEDLIINPRAGGIYRWVEENALTTRAVALSGTLVPTVGLQVITSEIDRHLIVLGADPISGSSRTGTIDPMLIAFSDQEDATNFEPLISNTAGSLRLSSGSVIIGAAKSRQEIIIFTDTSVYSMQFVGPPFTFAINLVNESTGLIGPKAAITASDGIYFMSYGNFYLYNATVNKLPCSVQNYVFSDFNNGQAWKVHGFTNSENNEVGWFYCSSDSTEIDRYVCYNYAENVWSYGQIERHAWLDAGVEPYPRATKDNYLYEHENGYNDDGSPMTNVYIESSDFTIGDGEQFAFVTRVIPDLRFLSNSNAGQVNMVLKTRDFPGDSLSTSSTSAITSSTQQAFIRARTRQAVLRIESDDDASGVGNNDVGWRVGATRIELRPDGRK